MFIKGIKAFQRDGKTPKDSHFAMVNLYVLTNGRFNDFMSWVQQIRHPKYPDVSPQGILGNLSQQDLIEIAREIRENGYYIADKRLNGDSIARIFKFAEVTPASYVNLSANYSRRLAKKIIFTPKAPISPRYNFSIQQIFENPDLLNLILDQSFLGVAQEYLNCSPVLDSAALWWSAPFNGKGTSEAAQEYHYDLSHLKFLKIFIYLTDVNSDNGPHCYVKGSHTRKPKALLPVGRKPDTAIGLHYPESEIHELCGPQGTIIIADTRGFHKGKPLVSGNRLIFQLEYSNSLFGANNPKVRMDKILDVSRLRQLMDNYPRTYSQIIDFSEN
ncbi:phytanoyl-CoA dioxygenase family protein [Moorena producens JHB]|uniref:Phytanoyl-CoA dioxygenase family protein n=1 Tax=Moorena producens (strain JHB) TaxID=1454205 RepID=A0A1D9G9S8_MOOP1|nr:phytanoyl-CoA dioxygenase family protein [Moorena producens JHB]